MATDAKNALANLVRGDGEQPVRVELMTVTGVREDGTVNLSWGSTPLEDVPASRSYGPRKAGDVVMVLQHAAGWRVLDMVGQPSSVDLPADVVYTSDIDDVVRVGDTMATTTTWGTAAPGAGWHQAQSVWVKDGAVYAQLGSAVDPPAPSTGKPQHHKPVPLSGKGQLYMDGRKNNGFNGGRPVQGAWPTYPHAASGIWTYGSQIAAACAGRTVAGMSLRLSRTTSGGNRSARPRLYLHDQSSAPRTTPALSSSWIPKATLSRGEIDTYDLPAAWVSQLASGAAKGVGCKAATGKSSYLRYGASSGLLTITFA